MRIALKEDIHKSPSHAQVSQNRVASAGPGTNERTMSFYTYSQDFRGAPNGWTPLFRGNFLVGENSTGKSSYLKLLKIVVSTDFQVRHLVYLRDRPDYNFDDFMSKLAGPPQNHRKFTIGCAGKRGPSSEALTGKLVSYVEDDGSPEVDHITFISGHTFLRLEGFDNDLTLYKKTVRSDAKQATILKKFAEFHNSTSNELGPPDDLAVDKEQDDDQEPEETSISLDFDRGISRSRPFVPDYVNNVDHLGPIRTRPGPIYHVGGDPKSIQGEDSLDKLAKDSAPILNACNRFGKRSGLFDKMHVKVLEELGPNNIVITFERAGRDFFAEELGYGVGQIVPVLIEATRPRGETILIAEQPELHLHPKAQAAFGSLMADFLRQKHRFLVETHSDFVLDRFRVELKNSKSRYEADSQILFFETKSGQNKVSRIGIAADGSIEEPPKSYRNFFLKETFNKISAL